MTTIDTKWNAGLYDDKHSFVSKFGEDLVTLLSPSAGERILDLGCGTGYLAHLIAESGAEVTGVDSSADMIGKARTAYPEITFRVMSATDLHFDKPFDAVFSNAVLHWVLDRESAIDSIYKNLRPGGRLVLEMGGRGNVEEIVLNTRKVLTRHGHYLNAATQVWYFPSLGEYATLLEKRGFRVRFATHYDRETELNDNENGICDWIRMFGNAFFRNIPETAIPALLEEIQESVRPTNYRNRKWYGDYKRLRILATK
ncbi:MAG: methyltransferase domain-containing protein [Puia sp.]|nr:methyltransferase domain-containing protein [Puia sp.]